jgi:hypothetical protein
LVAFSLYRSDQYFMDNTLQINSIKRALGSLYISLGAQTIRENQSEFSSTLGDINTIRTALNNSGLSGVGIHQLDSSYYFTSWDNWQKMISVLNPIAANFDWEAERFDCDNRSNLMSSLCSLVFRINTCSTLYCDVYDSTTGAYKYAHYCNLITDDAGNCYLWDVDYGGQYTKITSNPVIMGVNKYQFYSINCY